MSRSNHRSDPASGQLDALLQRLTSADVFCWGFALAPPLAVLAPLALAPLAVIMAVGALLLHWRATRTIPLPSASILAVSAAFIVWAGLTILWTVGFPESLRFWPRVTLYLVGGLALMMIAAQVPESQKERIGRFLLAGILTAVALLAVEGLTDGGIQRLIRVIGGDDNYSYAATYLNRSTAFLAILAWPAALVVARRVRTIAGIGTVLALTVFLTFFSSEKSVFGIVVGGIIFVFAWRFPRLAPPILAAAISLAILIAPLIARVPLHIVPPEKQEALSSSIGHRLIIWNFTSEKISERPLLGWGLNTSRVIPGGKEEIRAYTEYLPLHPHSAPLQWWLELGAIGAILLAMLIAIGITKLSSRFEDSAARGFGLGMVACATTIASVGYGIWQGWWVAALWISFAATAILSSSPRLNRPQEKELIVTSGQSSGGR